MNAKEPRLEIDRRLFLGGAGTLGTLLALPRTFAEAAVSKKDRERHSVWVDAQGVIDGFEPGVSDQYVLGERLAAALGERHLDAMSITIGTVGNGPDRLRLALDDLARIDRLVAAYPSLLSKIEGAADIKAARRGGRLGLIYNFQDTSPLEGDAGNVAKFAARGIRVMQLTYNRRNLAGDGCLEVADAGLTEFGRDVIGAMEEARVLLDLSHGGPRTIAEAIEASRQPMAITHSACRDLVDWPRNTWDTEMRALADKGGVFGVFLMPFLRHRGQPGPDDFYRHLDHAVNICGEDNVAIGTDNPLLGYEIDDTSRRQHRENHEARVARGIAAPGEQPDVLLYVEGYNGADRFERIAADLRRRGWTSNRIDKILGRNFARLLGEVWRD